MGDVLEILLAVDFVPCCRAPGVIHDNGIAGESIA